MRTEMAQPGSNVSAKTSGEFKSTEWCLGYKIVSQHETIEDFLAAVAKDRESMLHQIEDVFLPFVQETAKMVEEANQAVLAAGKL